MKEVGEWHRFLEVLVSWLALIDEAYVSEMRHCLKHPNVIEQAKLQSPVAARSAKLFYYLGQCLAKWERGLDLLRSVSKRQGLSAAGYEVVRTLHQHYSIVSRMEAVYVRDECLKIHSKCGHLKKPMDVVRYLEDELSKVESKLINFPELRLSEADKVSLILQAISAEARQYVVLRGHSGDWSSVSTTLKFYEEQLRMCELPGSSSNRALSEIICDRCGKKGHKKENCWQRKREERETAKEGGKTRPSRDGGKDQGKGKGKDEKGKSKGKGKDKGKGKGKDKYKKKKKKGAHARSASASSDGSEISSSGDENRAAAMALRAGGDVRDLSLCMPEPESPARSPVSPDRPRYCLGTLGSSSGQLDVDRVCSAQNVEPRDVWLVDSGATCHIVSSIHLSSFRVLKRHNRTVTLLNASGGEIVVRDVVDIEVHFDKLCLNLEDVLVADVTFNVLSPWSAAEKGWRTHLYRTGSRGKRSLKLEGVNRAWWALSGSKKSKSQRPPSKGKDMEIDSVACSLPSGKGPSPPPGILRKTPEDSKAEARSSSGTPRSLETTRSSESSSRRVLESSPFAFLIRSMRIAPRRGLANDIKEVSYSCEVETCVFDPECEVGSPKFCAACCEVEHVVHGCAWLDLGRMCIDGREAQTCDTQVEQVCKSKQTHEPCVALDLALLIGIECVKDESLELERCVEGSFAASEPSSPIDGHRRAGCGLLELLTPVMLLTETQLRDAVIGLILAVLAVVSCSFAWMGKLGRRLMNAGLSCRRPQKPQKSERRLFQISLWLKLAVFFALFVGAAGANNSFKSYAAMTSEETAQILAHGRQRVPSPLQCQTMARADVKEFLSLFGNVGLDALESPDARPLSRVFEGPFQENGLMNPWQVGPIAEEQELITGPPMLRSFGKWVPVTSPSLEMSMRLERSVWANHLWNPTISAGVAYLILKTPGLPQDGLGRGVLPTALRKRSSLIFLPATSMDNEEQQNVGKRRRIFEYPKDLPADL